MINYNFLENAIKSLEDILNQDMNEYIRDGAIQRFEFTFELTWKLLQRLLKSRGVESGSPKQVLRAAHQEGLIEDLDIWFEFLKSRNLTVHTYNQKLADEVFSEAKIFPEYARKVLEKIKENVD